MLSPNNLCTLFVLYLLTIKLCALWLVNGKSCELRVQRNSTKLFKTVCGGTPKVDFRELSKFYYHFETASTC